MLASNQVDISVTPLAETPDRLKVVDFVIYSSTSVCMFGLASNPKFATAKSVDDLNKPDITIAYYTGGGEEGWVKERFPKAQLRGVAGSGVAPVEEVMAKRADAVPINRVPWVAMGRKLKQLAVLPKDNNCQNSTEKAAPVGMAVDKNQPAFLQWARAVEKEMEPQLKTDEATRRRHDEVGCLPASGASPSIRSCMDFDFSVITDHWRFLAYGVWVTIRAVGGVRLHQPRRGLRRRAAAPVRPAAGCACRSCSTSIRCARSRCSWCWCGLSSRCRSSPASPCRRSSRRLIGLTVHLAAYVAEIVRAGIESVRPGQTRASLALGMSRAQIVRRIVLPQAIVRMLPAFGSLLSITIKDTAIASVIAVPELMRQSETLAGQSFQPIEVFTLCDAALFPDAVSGDAWRRLVLSPRGAPRPVVTRGDSRDDLRLVRGLAASRGAARRHRDDLPAHRRDHG